MYLIYCNVVHLQMHITVHCVLKRQSHTLILSKPNIELLWYTYTLKKLLLTHELQTAGWRSHLSHQIAALFSDMVKSVKENKTLVYTPLYILGRSSYYLGMLSFICIMICLVNIWVTSSKLWTLTFIHYFSRYKGAVWRSG